jgi:hypothetical protein
MIKIFTIVALTTLLGACASQITSTGADSGADNTANAGSSNDSRMMEDLEIISLKKIEIFSDEGGLYLQLYGPEKMIDNAKELVRRKMDDPGTVRFRNLRVVDYAKGSVVCGEVKDGSDSGEDTGYTPFVSGTSDAHLKTETGFEDINRTSDLGMNAAC